MPLRKKIGVFGLFWGALFILGSKIFQGQVRGKVLKKHVLGQNTLPLWGKKGQGRGNRGKVEATGARRGKKGQEGARRGSRGTIRILVAQNGPKWPTS